MAVFETVNVKQRERPAAIAPDEAEAALATLTLAFSADPVFRWLYPQADAYLEHFPVFADAFGGMAVAEGTAYRNEDMSAAAYWLRPGVEPDAEAIVAAVRKSVPEPKQDDLFLIMEDMGRAHPTIEHWYLPWFGVDIARQGRGAGAALMKQCLGLVDADGLPAYLETPNPRAVPFYERHGFEVTGQSQHGAHPPIVFMFRSARKR